MAELTTEEVMRIYKEVTLQLVDQGRGITDRPVIRASDSELGSK